jgi:cell division protein FtsB
VSFCAASLWIASQPNRDGQPGVTLGSFAWRSLDFGLDSRNRGISTLKMTVNAPIAKTQSRLASVLELWGRISIGRRKVATAAAALLALGVGYHVVFGANGLTVYEHKRQEMRSLNQQMQELQRENARLKGHVDSLQSDPNAIEHQAREQLHYTRPGEVIYTLPSK